MIYIYQKYKNTIYIFFDISKIMNQYEHTNGDLETPKGRRGGGARLAIVKAALPHGPTSRMRRKGKHSLF